MPARLPSMMGTTRFSVTDAMKPDAQTLKFIVLTCLFSWGRDKDTRQHGWWGAPDELFGSKLWQAQRSKLLSKSLSQLKSYMDQALSYLTSKKIADMVDVTVDRAGERVHASVTVTRGEEQTVVEFADLWRGI